MAWGTSHVEREVRKVCRVRDVRGVRQQGAQGARSVSGWRAQHGGQQRGVAYCPKRTASKGVGEKLNCGGECVVWKKNWSATRRVGELEVGYFTLMLKAAAAKHPQLRRHCPGKLILLRWTSVGWVSGRRWRWRRLGGIVGGSLMASRPCVHCLWC